MEASATFFFHLGSILYITTVIYLRQNFILDVANLWLLYGLELYCIRILRKLGAENSVLFESSRGLNFFYN